MHLFLYSLDKSYNVHAIQSFFLLSVHSFVHYFLFCSYSVFLYTSRIKVDSIGQSAAIIKSSHQCIS